MDKQAETERKKRQEEERISREDELRELSDRLRKRDRDKRRYLCNGKWVCKNDQPRIVGKRVNWVNVVSCLIPFPILTRANRKRKRQSAAHIAVESVSRTWTDGLCLARLVE